LFTNDQDTIFAQSSGLGKAAIALFRLSGPACFEVLEALCSGAQLPIGRVALRTVRHPLSHDPIDRALITRFEAPASFTGEDLAEISVTGGRAVTAALAEALASMPGLRAAEPGEFTWRAFSNGKIDLSEVEGLADLIEAETEAQRRQAQRIAGGALRRECEEIRSILIAAMAAVETQIDFSDVEDVHDLTLETAKRALHQALARIDRALAGALAGHRVREGFVIVIAGPPNVGKSTLLNALVGRDVAITSPFAGTTRDAIEIFLDLGGYPVILVDTAGIRVAEDPIEREGVERAKRHAKNADLTLWLDDKRDSDTPALAGEALFIRTKIDQPGTRTTVLRGAELAISAKTGEGIDDLLKAIRSRAEEQMGAFEPPILTLDRHRRAFQEARSSLASALKSSACECELLAEDIRRATAALDLIIGRIGVEEVLGEIFSRLCVGK